MSKRVLIVEDDDDVLALVKMRFEELGYLIESASSLAEAIKLAVNSMYDIYVVDMRLNNLDAMPLLEQISMNQHGENRTIIHTGAEYNEFDLRSLAKYFSSLVPKSHASPERIARIAKDMQN